MGVCLSVGFVLHICFCSFRFSYLHQGAYVIRVICLFVCLLATLCENLPTDKHEIFREGWQWANEQMIKFCWRSGSQIPIRSRIRIATLVRWSLMKACTVPVLLVSSASVIG